MADTTKIADTGISVRQSTGLSKAEISQQYNFGKYGKVREVVAAVSKLKQEGLPIVSNGSLYIALERIYLSLGRDFKIDLNSGGAKETERIERELLSIISNVEKPQEWVETDTEQMGTNVGSLDSKALNMQDLSKFLDEYQEGIERKERVDSLEERLAKKYKIDRSQVREWIDRLEEKEVLLKNIGFDEGMVKDIAEKVVIREERVRKELGRAGVKAKQIKTMAREIVERQIEAVTENKDFKVGSLKIEGIKLPKETGFVAERQARRIENEIRVAQLVEEGQRVFVADLEQGLQTSQPGIVFERHEDNIARLTREAMKNVWEGKYDDLESAEVNTGSIDKPRLMNFKEAVASEIKSDSGVVTIAIRSASQQTNNLLRKNIRLAAEYEFAEKSEGITDTILALNPKIDESVVVDYAEEVTKTTLPLQIPGDRNVRKISGDYGLNKDAVASANLFFRVSSGISDYKNLKEVTVKFEEAGGDSGIQISTSPETRVSDRFLNGLKRNPLLEKGVGVLKKRASGSLLANTTVVEGVTNFISNNLGFSTIFGIETATAVPAVMGYFSAGGTISGAIQGVMQAGGIANWVNGLITAGGVAAGATGEVAAGAGATAVTTGATVAGGTAAAGATVATGGVAAIVVAAGATITAGAKILKKIVGKVRDSFESMGVDTSVLNIFSKTKIQAKEKLGGLLGGVAGFVLDAGNLVIWSVGLAFSLAMAAIIKMIAPIVVGVFVFMFAYQTLVPILHGSAMVPGKESMGLGEGDFIGGGEFDPNGPPMIAEELAGMECSLVSKTAGPVMQCQEPWRELPLASGCTMCKAGCGIAAMSSISMRINSSLNPEYWTKNPIYSSASCGGTSISQARSALLSIGTFGSSDIRYDGGCSPTSIARSVCEGNKLIILAANFYMNSEATRVGGHFVTVIGVRNGEIVVMDPYYDEDGNGDGYTTPFLRVGESAHYGAIHSIKSCLIIDADKIN